MRVVFMGTPEFALAPLKALLWNGHQVVVVYTRPDRPAGRRRAVTPSPVKKLAVNLNLPLLQPAGLKKVETVAELKNFHPEVIVVAAYGQILPPPVLELPKYGCVNLHPSLLPRHRGASPVAAAILAGDEFSGVSIMLMDPGLDTGPILTRAQVPIAACDTAGSLTAKLSLVAAHLLLEILAALPRGELTPELQDEAGASYSGTVNKADGQIDWRKPAVNIWRRVRAFQPWPGSYTRWQGKMLKIIEAAPLPPVEATEVGQVVALSSSMGKPAAAFGVATGDGVLGILKVQLEGKRALSSAEFMRGQRKFLGSVLSLS